MILSMILSTILIIYSDVKYRKTNPWVSMSIKHREPDSD